MSDRQPGYHLAEIKKGELGEISKLYEEVEELADAKRQGVRIMMMVELSDLYGAIESFMEKHLPGITMGDLAAMSHVTKRAFRNGRR